MDRDINGQIQGYIEMLRWCHRNCEPYSDEWIRSINLLRCFDGDREFAATVIDKIHEMYKQGLI